MHRDRREYARKYYQEHKEQFKEYAIKYQKEHPERVHAWKLQWRLTHKNEEAEYKRVKQQQRKLDVLSHYALGGLSCARCKISDIDVLTIDHINGGGSQHRKSLINRNLYRWIQRNNYPSGFQVLCFNCNMKKRIKEDGGIKISN